jgi:hypothetical protein
MGDEVPVNTYSYSLHILDSSGALAAQADFGFPPDHDYRCRAVKLDTQDLPAGDYSLSLVVYAWENGQRLDAVNAGSDSGDHIDLETLHVG